MIEVRYLWKKDDELILLNQWLNDIFTDDNRMIIWINGYKNYPDWSWLYEVILEDYKTVLVNGQFVILRSDNYFDMIKWNSKITLWEPFYEHPDIFKFNNHFLILVDWILFSDYKKVFINSMWNEIKNIYSKIKWDNWEELLIVDDNYNWLHYLNNQFKILSYKWYIVNLIKTKNQEINTITDVANKNIGYIHIEINTADRWILNKTVKKSELKFI